MRANRRRQITMTQVREVQRQMTLARAVAPFATSGEPVQYKNRKSGNVTVIGTTDQFLFTDGMTVSEGRFMSGEEAQGGRPVCMLGFQVSTNLFPNEPALGTKVKIGGQSFEVIGVMEKQGSLFGESLDNQVVVPVKQFVTQFWHDPDYEIHVKVVDMAHLEDAKEELRGILRRVRHLPPGAEDDFGIEQQESILRTFNRVAGTIAAIGLFITGLSLFVGGIGIMNIMFVSVAERTKEIGIRKAIGAKRRAILIQFLTEATSICLLGGLIALAIAWPLTFAIGQLMPARMSLPIVGIALFVSILTGALSGFFPAWRAARMNPVDALRNE
jgi:putative ABC transport system permease protein